MKLFLEKKLGKESKKPYIALYADLGYTVVTVSMESDVVLKIADLRYSELNSLKVDTPLVLGEIVKTK